MKALSDYRDIISPVIDHARENPNHPAFIFEGRTTTYAELLDDAHRIAMWLTRVGIVKGDRIAVLTENRVELFSIYLGAALLGAATIPLNADYGPSEIGYILGHAEPALLVATKPSMHRARESIADRRIPMGLVEMDVVIAEAKALLPSNASPAASDDTLVLLCYTSGTTGAPKGVAATHANEIASAAGYCAMWAMRPTDRVLVALPLTFSFGFHAAVYVALLAGATVLLLPKFQPQAVIGAIDTLQATTFLGVPTMYAMMANYARDAGTKPSFAGIRLAASSGAALNEQTVEDCRTHLALEVRPYYAMTEVRPIFSFDLRNRDQPPRGSVGTLIAPTQARIVTEHGREADANEVGELLVRGPSFSGAYYRDPERTATALEQGWFKTGDLASRDEKGNYFIVGRTREQIISGGAKIAPIEVENVLLEHPAIAAAAVVGWPDPLFGEIVKAVVVKAKAELTAADVIAHCQNRLAIYKVPKLVTFMDALPLAPSGKVLKAALS